MQYIRKRASAGSSFSGEPIEEQPAVMSLDVWLKLALFMAVVLTFALYVLAASGQFPAEHRAASFKSAAGVTILFGSMAAVALALLFALAFAWRFIPWYAAVIGGGLVVIFAPLILQWFSDAFVNGRAALLAFAGASITLVALTLAM